jgi:hypothetical protein
MFRLAVEACLDGMVMIDADGKKAEHKGRFSQGV